MSLGRLYLPQPLLTSTASCLNGLRAVVMEAKLQGRLRKKFDVPIPPYPVKVLASWRGRIPHHSLTSSTSRVDLSLSHLPRALECSPCSRIAGAAGLLITHATALAPWSSADCPFPSSKRSLTAHARPPFRRPLLQLRDLEGFEHIGCAVPLFCLELKLWTLPERPAIPTYSNLILLSSCPLYSIGGPFPAPLPSCTNIGQHGL